ncbi:MAG: phosphotransferase [Pseudomonadota bacterium]
MSFPSAPEQLTSAWLSDQLGYVVNNFRVEQFGAGAGIIGMVTRLHLECSDGPRTVIAKFPSPAEENRAVAATYDMYGREIFFYQQIAPTINLRVPECYHADYNAADQAFVILMEDLQGWRIGDQVAGCTTEEAAAVISAIARLHAAGWQSPMDIVSHNNPAQVQGMQGGFAVGWPVVQAQFADLIPPGAAELGDKVPAKVPALLAQMCAEPVCISHADVRLDNIFFADDDIALVDWQSLCLSAPEHDLAYFVTQSLATEVRQSRDWVAQYHNALSEELQRLGVPPYPLAKCRERFRICAAYLVCYAVIISGTLDLGNERGMALGRTLFGNAMQSLDEMDAFSLFD